MPIRVLLADDHRIVRQGLRSLLSAQSDIIVVGETGDGRETVQLAESLQPDVVVMDISMPLLNGIEATRQIVSRTPEVAVVMLSMHGGDEYILRALQAGALGYVLKQSVDTELIMAIRAAQRGESFLSPTIARRVINSYLQQAEAPQTQDRYELLTEREREVLQLVAEGKSMRETADLLCISPRTAAKHKSNLMAKLDIHHTACLVRFAIRRGVVALDD